MTHMPEKEAMLKEVINKAALALIGTVVLGPAFYRIRAQENTPPAVRSEMLVPASWLEQHLNDRDLVVLYVGHDRGQFDSGHIPGSRFVRLDELVEQHKSSLNELPTVSDLEATYEWPEAKEAPPIPSAFGAPPVAPAADSPVGAEEGSEPIT